jgi:hypothetical protein
MAYYASQTHLVNPKVVTEEGVIAPGTVGLLLSRTFGEGLHEDLDIRNYSGKHLHFILEVLMRSDFADLFEVKAKQLVSGSTVKRASTRSLPSRVNCKSNGAERAAPMKCERHFLPRPRGYSCVHRSDTPTFVRAMMFGAEATSTSASCVGVPGPERRPALESGPVDLLQTGTFGKGNDHYAREFWRFVLVPGRVAAAGAPLAVKNDCRGTFRSGLLRELLAGLGSRVLHSPAYRLGSNGSVDAGNKSLKRRTAALAATA